MSTAVFLPATPDPIRLLPFISRLMESAMLTITQSADDLRAQAARLKESALGSFDPAVHAEAIALSSDTVVSTVAEKAVLGLSLVSVMADSFGSDARNCKVVLLFEDAVALQTRMLVVVDVPARVIREVRDPYDEIARGGCAAPFALAIPSKARRLVADAKDLQGHRAREMAFMGEIGVVVPRIFSSSTYNSTAYQSAFNTGTDQVEGDHTTDYVNDLTGDPVDDDAV